MTEKENIIHILEKMKEKNIDNSIDIEKVLQFVKKQKYGLNFEKHTEEINEMFKTHIPIIEEIKEKRIEKNNGIYNLLIEGDNLHSLNVLKETYSKSVDVLYIDPPYNTKKDFLYNDKILKKNDEYKHSCWLSFINERLQIAKELLTDKGIIFISIDEHESANLKLLCDDIFGEKNFITEFLWKKSHGGSTLSKCVRSNAESIYCYAKNLNKIDFDFFGKVVKKNSDSPLINMPNKYSTLIFPPYSIEFKSIKNGTIKSFKNNTTELHNDIFIKNYFNTNEVIFSNHWKWTQKKLKNELQQNTKIISKTKNLKLRYIKEETTRIVKPTQFITPEENVGYTISASHELTNILEENIFEYPKPVSLIKYLIKMVTYQNKDATILDFFAGSGTTGQAVLELNEEDGGNRKFILCTNNENEICEKITYQRLKTIITGIRKNGTKYSNGFDSNLKYYKCTFIKK